MDGSNNGGDGSDFHRKKQQTTNDASIINATTAVVTSSSVIVTISCQLAINENFLPKIHVAYFSINFGTKFYLSQPSAT
ncbi:MAG: hypothetical protein LBG86_00840 [Puniceicoccales bacterium]|jgi:hypothetical protein|nr:hypothetical protein [Puniceicoccales bacterium]